MLGGEAGQGMGAEVGEVVDRAGGLCETLLQCGGLVLEPGDLGVAWVGEIAGLLEGAEPVFELGA